MGKTANDKHTLTPEAAVDRLEAIYAGSCAALSRALDRYLATRKPPTAKDRAAFRYPLLRVVCRQVGAAARTRRAYAKFQRPGVYATTVTHPRHFRRYLLEQLEPLVAEYGAEIAVDVSSQEIPYPYVLERVDDIGRTGVTASELAAPFPDAAAVPRRRRGGGRPVGGAGGRAAPALPVRCGAGRLLAAPPRALHRQRLAQRAAVDPAHQLSPLRRPVRALGPGAPRRATAPTSAWCCRAAPRSGAATRPRRPRKPSPPAPGTASRCRPTT